MQGAVDNSKTNYPKGNHHKNMVWKIRRGSRDNASNSSDAAKVYMKGSDSGSHSSRTSSGRSPSDQRYQSTTKSGESARSVNSRQSDGLDHHSATTGSSGSSIHASKSSAGGRRSLQHSVDNRTPTRYPAEKSVRFKDIHIRDYERIVGDNPSCSSGPPIGLGWAHGDTRTLGLDAFENARPERRSVRIAILTREEREQLLLSWGVSFNEIIDSIRANIKVKNQRRQTVTNLGKVERIEEAFESATRKLKRALLLRRRTGDKVKRLKEQSELAAHALHAFSSLKIAEDDALNEIRANEGTIEREPEHDNLENLEVKVSVSDFCKMSPAESKIQRAISNLSDGEDAASTISGFTLGNSTTASMQEVERFYRELELELFGDTELPSMVGQTLELSGIDISKETRDIKDPPSVAGYPVDDGSNPAPKDVPEHDVVPKNLYPQPTGIGLVLKDFNNSIPADESRSMLSRALEQHQYHKSRPIPIPEHNLIGRDPAAPDSLHQHYPRTPCYDRDEPQHAPYYPDVRLSSSLDSCDMSSRYARVAVAAVEQQYLHRFGLPSPPPPTSIPPSGFRHPYPMEAPNETPRPRSNPRRNIYASSPRAGAGGPDIRHVPPPTYLTPAHMMEDCEGPRVRRLEKPITITEESYEPVNMVFRETYQQQFASDARFDLMRQPLPCPSREPY